MKIEHLRYFASFAGAESINQAAKELFISQQQLNRILTSLENELRVKLFERSSRGTQLTEDGREFAKYANKILTEYSAMQSYFLMRKSTTQLQTQSVSGKCTIYIPPFVSLFLSDMIKKFKEIAPNIELTCIEDSSPITTHNLLLNQLHLVSCAIPDEVMTEVQEKMHIIPLAESKIYLCVNKNSELANLSVVERGASLGWVNTISPVTPLGTYLDEQIVFISSNIYQHLDSVVQNQTVCTLPDFVLPKIKPMYPDVVTIPFEEDNTTPCQIIYPTSYILSEADEVLISFLKLYFQSLQLMSQKNCQ